MENKMTIIAALFNKQLGEMFQIKHENTIYTADFWPRGLHLRGQSWNTCDRIFKYLLIGEAKIV